MIAFTGDAHIDTNSLPVHQVAAYIKKYKDGIAGLPMTQEEFSSEYSVPIRIRPTKV